MSSRAQLEFSLYAAIAVAAALGGVLRYGVSIAWLAFFDSGWPWPTLLVNVVGSLMIAIYWRMAGPGGRFAASVERRVVVMTGFCGGLTTFSMFGVETLHLLTQSRWAGAIAYVALTGAAALGAAWIALCGRPRVRQG